MWYVNFKHRYENDEKKMRNGIAKLIRKMEREWLGCDGYSLEQKNVGDKNFTSIKIIEFNSSMELFTWKVNMPNFLTFQFLKLFNYLLEIDFRVPCKICMIH
jgi:hypothetical protein